MDRPPPLASNMYPVGTNPRNAKIGNNHKMTFRVRRNDMAMDYRQIDSAIRGELPQRKR